MVTIPTGTSFHIAMKLGLFSVSYAGYWGQEPLSLLHFVAKAAELGYESVMLAGKRPHLSPLDASPNLLEELESALSRHNVTCDVVAGYTNLVPEPVAEVPAQEMQIAYVESLARIGAELGAKIVRVFTAYETDRCGPYAVWNTVVKTLQEMCDRAARYDVVIAIQNHHDIGVHSDALLEMLSDIDRPNCRLGFDAWSPALRGEDLYSAAKSMAPYMAITTNADYVCFPRHRLVPEVINYRRVEPDLVRAVKFGEGFIDYASFFRGLIDGGFNGVANYEMCSQIRGGGAVENLDAYAKCYVEWMNRNASDSVGRPPTPPV